jgi:hypothetical protein
LYSFMGLIIIHIRFVTLFFAIVVSYSSLT